MNKLLKKNWEEPKHTLLNLVWRTGLSKTMLKPLPGDKTFTYSLFTGNSLREFIDFLPLSNVDEPPIMETDDPWYALSVHLQSHESMCTDSCSTNTLSLLKYPHIVTAYKIHSIGYTQMHSNSYIYLPLFPFSPSLPLPACSLPPPLSSFSLFLPHSLSPSVFLFLCSSVPLFFCSSPSLRFSLSHFLSTLSLASLVFSLFLPFYF